MTRWESYARVGRGDGGREFRRFRGDPLLAAAAIMHELPQLVPDRLPGVADELRAAIASARELGDGQDREDAIDKVLGILASAPETRERLNELGAALLKRLVASGFAG
jgi:hypothetical protein